MIVCTISYNGKTREIQNASIKEVPAYSKAEDTPVQRVMWCKEVHTVAVVGIDVAHHNKEACALQMEVGIDIHNRIVSHLRAALTFLHGKLSESRAVIGCVVLREETCVGTQIAFQNMGELEPQVQVRVDIQRRKRYDAPV